MNDGIPLCILSHNVVTVIRDHRGLHAVPEGSDSEFCCDQSPENLNTIMMLSRGPIFFTVAPRWLWMIIRGRAAIQVRLPFQPPGLGSVT